MAKRLLRKVLKIFFLSLAFLLLTGFVLFCVLIMNPFAADYSRSLLTLAPASSDAAVHLANPQQLQRRVSAYVGWNKLRERPGFRNWYDRLYRELQPLLALDEIGKWRKLILDKTDIDIFDIDYVFGVLARETAVAIKYHEQQPEFVLLSRVGWQIQLADGLVPYVLSKKQRQRFGIELGKIRSVAVPGQGTFYWMCYRDVLLLANSRTMIEDASGLARSRTESLYDIRQGLQQQAALLQEQQGDILLYVAAPDVAKRLHLPQLKVDLPADYCGRLNLKNEIKLEFEAVFATPNASQLPLLSLTQSSGDIGQQLPAETFAYGTLAFEVAQIWPQLWSLLPPGMQRQAKPYLDKLNQHFQTADLPAKLLQQYMEGPVVWTMALTDFDKENLQPLDPYPNAGILIKSPQPAEFINTMHEVLERLRAEVVTREMGKSDFTFFSYEQYANRPYLRIKFPDSSGGAIQPVIGAVGQHIVVSSHVAFLKNLIDLHDQLGSSLQNTDAYHKMEKHLQEPRTIHAFMHSGGPVKTANLFRDHLLSCWISYLPRQIRMQPARKQVWLELGQEVLNNIGLIDAILHFELDISKDKLQGKLVLPLHLRE